MNGEPWITDKEELEVLREDLRLALIKDGVISDE